MRPFYSDAEQGAFTENPMESISMFLSTIKIREKGLLALFWRITLRDPLVGITFFREKQIRPDKHSWKFSYGQS